MMELQTFSRQAQSVELTTLVSLPSGQEYSLFPSTTAFALALVAGRSHADYAPKPGFSAKSFHFFYRYLCQHCTSVLRSQVLPTRRHTERSFTSYNFRKNYKSQIHYDFSFEYIFDAETLLTDELLPLSLKDGCF